MSKIEFIYGYQTLREIIQHRPEAVQRLFLQQKREDGRVQELIQLAQMAGIPISWASRNELDQLLGVTQHQGMAIQCHKIPPMSEALLKELLADQSKPALLLILDGVQDPHNLGACIRTANAMGADAVIAPKDRAVGLTDVVHKAACGATAITPFIQVTNLARTLREIKECGIWLVAMDAEAKAILPEIDAGPRVGLVMGGEGQGIRRLTLDQCDFFARIPMYGTVESLNVSVAAAIGLYELKH